MNRKAIPESVRKQLQRAGKARAAQMTADDRHRYGKKAWKTRVANAAKE